MGILYMIEMFFRKYLITPIQKFIFKNIIGFNVIYIITEIVLVAFCIFLLFFFIGGRNVFIDRIKLKYREDK